MTVRTRGGKEVIGLSYIPTNSCGKYVTFPIKGSIIRRRNPLKLEYGIWTLDGCSSVLEDTPDDLMIG